MVQNFKGLGLKMYVVQIFLPALFPTYLVPFCVDNRMEEQHVCVFFLLFTQMIP